MNNNYNKVRVCTKCGKILPISKFRFMKRNSSNSYFLGQCRDCEYKKQREYLEEKNKITFSNNLEYLIDIKYKKIKQERILDLDKVGILPIGTDEIFVKLMDYKGYFLSNYGRCIHYVNGQYNLLMGGYDSNGVMKYTVSKNVYSNGKWGFKRIPLFAHQAVVTEFIVNPDAQNNTFIWHGGYNKEDNYYRNLYPLNQEQYWTVKKNFTKTGDDSENFIRSVMNEMKYKPNTWSKKVISPTVCRIGYHGSENIDRKSVSYLRWRDMINRCYNDKFHERQPQYKDCEVCVEWHNYCNFKLWYERNYYQVGEEQMDLDKDILFKGNKIYSPETCCIVPHSINTLFLNCAKNRGELPVGVWYDNEKGKFRSGLSYCGQMIKLGTFNTTEEAFKRYKVYKEDLIRDIAEQYKGEIPYKVYEAMKNWEVDIED